ncbi:MAG: hypothetical protein KY476_18515, partial [Planctomycetes bacterium]|nr:hypothetical protein [Planctomycetota bacterium]
ALPISFDGVAVPLPASFQTDVERAIEFLPGISAVVQEEPRRFAVSEWSPERELEDEFDAEERDERRTFSYVPIDPCQGVIAALRIAIGEHMPRHFIDLETERFRPLGAVLPDPYALKQTRSDKFAAAVLPAIPRLPEGQPRDRATMMAHRLRILEQRHKSLLLVCSIMDWPWIREAYLDGAEPAVEDDLVEETAIHAVDPASTLFMLGELPFITALYERARSELDDDENLSIDGIKELLLTTRRRYEGELKKRARKITPKLLSVYFQYVRNLALVERRMTPDLYTLVVAAQQIGGDQFAIHLLETARAYPDTGELPFPMLKMGIDEARLADGDVAAMKCRLPGPLRTWRSCELKPMPPRQQQEEWAHRWNPFGQCSWPPEDTSIERFRTHVKDAAMAIMGNDLARVEKFTTSLKDGLDIRETLRNWHTGDLYVKNFPPARGSLDCVVMLFDSPADPRDYPWRITWHAEHHDESTLSLFATDFRQNIVGPGIALATYGGASFLFPPRPVPDIWRDRRFDFADTLEERLVAAACYHTQQRHVALLSHAPPGAGFRRLAKKYGVKLVHVPLSRFSQATIQQLRMFHVLNGRQVRSFAAHFIRKA